MTARLRLRPSTVPETELHASVAQALDLLLLPPAVWCTYPAGHIQLPPAAAAKLARLGLKRGLPDILIFHDGAHGIELKTGDGTLSKTRTVRTRRGALRVLEGQSDVFPRLEAAGMRIAVCRDVRSVLEALTGWGIPVRTFTVAAA